MSGYEFVLTLGLIVVYIWALIAIAAVACLAIYVLYSLLKTYE